MKTLLLIKRQVKYCNLRQLWHSMRKSCAKKKFDGYYAIITSEFYKTNEAIVDIYRGIWKIKKSFKVAKSDLKARPVFVTRENHIQAHFLICFIALIILRILENRLGSKFFVSRIAESLSLANGYALRGNWYVFGFTDEVLRYIEEVTGVPLIRQYLKIGDIRKILDDTKK